jgi:hypothetical protein
LYGAQVTELAFGFLAGVFGTPALSDEIVNFGTEVKAEFVSYVGGWVGAE